MAINGNTLGNARVFSIVQNIAIINALIAINESSYILYEKSKNRFLYVSDHDHIITCHLLALVIYRYRYYQDDTDRPRGGRLSDILGLCFIQGKEISFATETDILDQCTYCCVACHFCVR